MLYTRLQFRDVIRQRLGWPAADQFVVDTELNSYINDSLAELHSLLVTAHTPGSWGVAPEAIVIVPGQNTYQVSATDQFGRLLSVRLTWQNEWVPIRKFDPTVDTISLNARSWTPDSVRWWLNSADSTLGHDAALTFTPMPDSAQEIIVLYVVSAPIFTTDADTSFMGHDEYVVLDCMLKCMQKEEADTTAVRNQKDAYAMRIRTQAEPLDIGAATTVQDARAAFGEDYDYSRAQTSWFHR
jgi:hypothetical protein